MYDDGFYRWSAQQAARSAPVVMAVVLEHVAPTSVVDVGCGTGHWLRACADLAGADILGLESEAVPDDQLVVPTDRLRRVDLTQPITLTRAFDLAISLEVAEHLAPERADGFVRDLTRLAPAVLFSAAIPGQGGTLHRNEQPQSSWIRRFAACGYDAWDVIRPAIWSDPRVAFWYRQNTFLFVDPAVYGHAPERAPVVADLSVLTARPSPPPHLARRIVRRIARTTHALLAGRASPR